MDITGKPTETTNLGNGNSNSLSQQPGTLHGTDLITLHIYDCCVAWFICGTPGKMGVGADPGALASS